MFNGSEFTDIINQNWKKEKEGITEVILQKFDNRMQF